MNPAFSVVFFTTVAGAAQGLVVMLALATLGGAAVASDFVGGALLLGIVLLVTALAASFGHLGRKERAWRAVLMWRTSWLSRECIVLPAFIGWVALWWLAQRAGASTGWLAAGAIVLAALLWYCTAMIYACLRFIEEWAHPLTLANFALTGLACGAVLASALAAWRHEGALLAFSAPAALLLTLLAGALRLQALRRNARLRHRSTLQSATGIHSARLVQNAMGMTGGSFNTREFFHGATQAALKNVKRVSITLGFALPSLLALWALLAGATWPWLLALPLQALGLLADRWFFFAQAKHPQNLYYQVVS